MGGGDSSYDIIGRLVFFAFYLSPPFLPRAFGLVLATLAFPFFDHSLLCPRMPLHPLLGGTEPSVCRRKETLPGLFFGFCYSRYPELAF